MLTGKKIILFGSGQYGRRALNFFGPDKVYCFADNNKSGERLWDKNVISFDELMKIKDNFDVVLTVNFSKAPALEEQCKAYSISYNFLGDLMSHNDFESIPEICLLENIHKEKRCFLIGNGPSLTVEDLTILYEHSEISFACNNIAKILIQTPWRPTYYLFHDFMFLDHKQDSIYTGADYNFFPKLNDVTVKNIAVFDDFLKQFSGKIFYYNSIPITPLHPIPRFSPNASKALYLSSTVMYLMIQIVVYMGFSHIYLIGVDGTMSSLQNPSEYMSEKRHFYEEDIETIIKKRTYSTSLNSEDCYMLMTNAYQKADEYTRERGIKIYNATRGGKIEVFERVNFGSLFNAEAKRG